MGSSDALYGYKTREIIPMNADPDIIEKLIEEEVTTNRDWTNVYLMKEVDRRLGKVNNYILNLMDVFDDVDELLKIVEDRHKTINLLTFEELVGLKDLREKIKEISESL